MPRGVAQATGIAAGDGRGAGHGIADYRIVESLGATEGAPASGAADLIVDITTTGNTLRANGLKVLADGVILRSEAYLVASLAAKWGKTALRGAGMLLAQLGVAPAAERLVQRLSENSGRE